jgi:hypothetical protein
MTSLNESIIQFNIRLKKQSQVGSTNDKVFVLSIRVGAYMNKAIETKEAPDQDTFLKSRLEKVKYSNAA